MYFTCLQASKIKMIDSFVDAVDMILGRCARIDEVGGHRFQPCNTTLLDFTLHHFVHIDGKRSQNLSGTVEIAWYT